MPSDPSVLDEDLDPLAWKQGGGKPSPIPSAPIPGPMFGFGIGGAPGFGPGFPTGLRRRFAFPVTAASQRNRFAQPMSGQQTVGGAMAPRSATPMAGGQPGGIRGMFSGGLPQQQQMGAGPAQGPGYLNDLFAQYAGGSNGLDYALLGQLGQAGGFDPMGSPALIEALRQQALQSTRASEMSSRTAALMNAGNDPLMQAQAAMGARLGGASDQNRGLMQARSQSALQNTQFLQAMAAALQGGERGLAQQMAMARFAQELQPKPGFGDFMGGLLGMGLGGWAGGGFNLGG